MDFGIHFEWLITSLLILAGIGIGLWQYDQARRKQLLIDLQGDKNAVGAVAMRVWSDRFPRKRTRWSSRHRRELFEALCLAAVFQQSGRTRSLIYGALAHAEQTVEYRVEIREIIERITLTVSRSWGYTDLHRARTRLIMLRAALQLDKDVRLRLDAAGLGAQAALEQWPPDPRLVHRAFDRSAVSTVVEKLGHLVVVGPSEDASIVIALDYHRAIQKPDPHTRESPLPTRVGAAVIAAKYPKPGENPERARRALTHELATVIKTHPAYRSATSVVAVPGRHRHFSDRLAEDVAAEAEKPFVSITRQAHGADETPRFVVEDPTALSGAVVLVDDVYRSGRTLQAVAKVLENAGVEVLGLTATCTISAAALPCDQDACHDHPSIEPAP